MHNDVVRHAAVQGLRVAPDPTVSRRAREAVRDGQGRADAPGDPGCAGRGQVAGGGEVRRPDPVAMRTRTTHCFCRALEAAETAGGPEATAAVL